MLYRLKRSIEGGGGEFYDEYNIIHHVLEKYGEIWTQEKYYEIKKMMAQKLG